MVLFFVSLFIAGNSFAQNNARDLPVGTAIEGSFGFGEEVWYIIRPNQTSFMIIETTGDTDTYLEIYDVNNNLLMEDDDAGEGTNARVDIHVRTGTSYFIKVRGFDSSIAGLYSIQARFIPMPVPVELRIGVPYSGRISAGEDYWFSVRSANRGTIVVETTGNTDTYLDVYNSSYIFMASDDDSGQDKNARVEIIAGANQIYYFKLRAYSRNASGSYRIQAYFEQYVAGVQPDDIPAFVPLLLTEPLPPDSNRNTNRSSAIPVDENEIEVILYGALNESRWYSFDVTNDDTAVIIRTKGIIIPFLYLYNSEEELITTDYYSGEENNALIFETLDTGTYFIEVMEFFNRAGRCTLDIEFKLDG